MGCFCSRPLGVDRGRSKQVAAPHAAVAPQVSTAASKHARPPPALLLMAPLAPAAIPLPAPPGSQQAILLPPPPPGAPAAPCVPLLLPAPVPVRLLPAPSRLLLIVAPPQRLLLLAPPAAAAAAIPLAPPPAQLPAIALPAPPTAASLPLINGRGPSELDSSEYTLISSEAAPSLSRVSNASTDGADRPAHNGCDCSSCDDDAATCSSAGPAILLVAEGPGLYPVFASAQLRDGVHTGLSGSSLAGLLAAADGDCGNGGQGSVTRVQLPVAPTPLAIKATTSERISYQDFARECDVWTAWHAACPQYVVPLLAAQFERCEAGASSGRAFYAMPECPLVLGLKMKRLHAQARKRGGLSQEDLAFVRRLLASLLVALEAAHAQGIVWGDLKPQNVMLAPSGAPRIIDFGSAARVPHGGLRRAPVQSPGFGAPECCEGGGGSGEMGCGIDVWGAGSLAAYMVLGYSAWHGCVDGDTDLMVPGAVAALWPSSSTTGAPPELGALRDLVLERLLVADPSRRTNAAEAMAHPYFEGLDWEDVRSGAAWE